MTWKRLLALLGFAPAPDLSARKELYFGKPKVVDLDRERLKRMRVVFVVFVSEPSKTRWHD